MKYFNLFANVTIEFELQTKESIQFAGFSGIALRAALYTIFTELYDTGKTINSNKDIEHNPLRWLFAPNNHSHTIPRPYIIRPPLKISNLGFKFGITLLGNATKYVQQIISCVVGMQSIGLGINRQSFRIKSISQVNLFTGERLLLLDQNGNSVHSLKQFNEMDILKSIAHFSTDLLKIKFLTPTMIIDKRLLLTKPIFRATFQRLLERFLHINKYYGNQDIKVTFDILLKDTNTIRLISDETNIYGKQQGNRYSRNIVGFTGEATYQGDFRKILMVLTIGQILNVGKNTTKGCGWFKLEQDFL